MNFVTLLTGRNIFIDSFHSRRTTLSIGHTQGVGSDSNVRRTILYYYLLMNIDNDENIPAWNLNSPSSTYYAVALLLFSDNRFTVRI